jgi:hypothetical protein
VRDQAIFFRTFSTTPANMDIDQDMDQGAIPDDAKVIGETEELSDEEMPAFTNADAEDDVPPLEIMDKGKGKDEGTHAHELDK